MSASAYELAQVSALHGNVRQNGEGIAAVGSMFLQSDVQLISDHIKPTNLLKGAPTSQGRQPVSWIVGFFVA